MVVIFKKELWNYFGNWSAWMIIAGFSVVVALFLFFFENDSNLLDIGTASLQSYFVLVPWLLMFAIPALAMRTVAEERQNGTLQWLFSQPLRISDIVLGKFFAVWLIGILCILPSLVYFYTIFTLGVPPGNLDFGAAAGSYFGLILLTGAFCGLGILASALASNQIMAFLIGIFLSFIAYFGIEQLANFRLLGGADYFLQNLGFYRHFLGFTRGLMDSRDLFYFLLIMMLCMVLSINFIKNIKK